MFAFVAFATIVDTFCKVQNNRNVPRGTLQRFTKINIKQSRIMPCIVRIEYASQWNCKTQDWFYIHSQSNLQIITQFNMWYY